MPAPPEDPPPPAGDADAPAPAPGPDPAPTAAPAPAEEEDDRVFLVPRRWWRDAQEGAAIDAAGLPYVAAPAGPTSYGMRVLSIFISDQTYTLRRADDLLHQPPDASSSARSYALVAADLFTKARD